MREIKFKYYCKDMAGKVFSFITTIEDLEQAKLNINTYGRIQEIIARCQFTGLKDKNGKEIYEGDIVKLDTPDNIDFPTRYRTIIFNQKFAQFCVSPCTALLGWKSIEVIGNIY